MSAVRASILAFVLSFLSLPLFGTCINGGTDTTIRNALGNTANAEAVLCQGSVFDIYAAVNFTAPGQKIYTEGYPGLLDHALLRAASSSVTRIIGGLDQSDVELRNVTIDGRVDVYGYLRNTGTALIDFGGEATGQVIDSISAFGTREWSTISIYGGNEYFSGGVWNGGCTDATITNNWIANAGDVASGNWADGISLGCRESLVADNFIWNATDGNIVVFAAPGSIIEDNTIEVTTEALGGINLVDYSFAGDYGGTIVRNNTIRTATYVSCPICPPPPPAYIHVGIAIGHASWFGCSTSVLRDGTVTGNNFDGGFGYAITVDGATDWTVTGNTTGPSFSAFGTPASDGCVGTAAAAGAFKKHGVHATGTYQANFVEGKLHRAAAITP